MGLTVLGGLFKCYSSRYCFKRPCNRPLFGLLTLTVLIMTMGFCFMTIGLMHWDLHNSRMVAAAGGTSAQLSQPQQRNAGDRMLKMMAPTTTASSPIDAINQPQQQTEDEVSGHQSELLHRYKIRKERIKEVCQLAGVVTHDPVFVTYQNASQPINSTSSGNAIEETPNTSHFALAPPYRTMGCFLNKVASSSLVTAFLQVHGLGPTFTSPHSYVFKLHPKSMEEFLEANATYFKFMFVRHPMKRMLSCYIDKMIESNHEKLPAFRNYVHNKGRQIIQQRHYQSLRKASGQTANQKKADYNFITHPNGRRRKLLSNAADNASLLPSQNQAKSSILRQQNSNANSSMPNVTPTYEEFLEFVLNTDLQGVGYDAHWVPYHRYCSPCSMNYDVIGKLETGEEDFKYVWEKTGLAQSHIPVPWFNNKATAKLTKSKIDAEKKYYSSLPRELILRFYAAFRLDFEMFGYSINEILLKGGHEPIDELSLS